MNIDQGDHHSEPNMEKQMRRGKKTNEIRGSQNERWFDGEYEYQLESEGLGMNAPHHKTRLILPTKRGKEKKEDASGKYKRRENETQTI